MQTGACTTALDGARDDVNHSIWKGETFIDLSNWKEKPLSESIENTAMNLSNWNDKPLSESKEPKPVKARKGGGDTNTKGKHSTRYNAYCKAVKTGKITPTVYGLTKHKIDGVGIGVETARGFLIEMEKAGVVSKADKGGKTMYVLA